jgi:thiamine kinase
LTDAFSRDRERLADVARRLALEHPSVQPLVGGSRNRCYRLAGAGADVVVRIAGPGDEAYAVARDAESLAHRLAAAHGLAPRLLLEDATAGVMVMEHARGPVWSRERATFPDGPARIGAWLRRLHAIAVPRAMRRVCFLANLEHYCAALGPAGATGRLLAEARRTAHGRPPGAAPVFCHNDLHHLNLVESDGGLFAIDWEYAGAGDAVMDLAGFVAYHDLGDMAVQALLDAYCRDQVRVSAQDLAAARWLFEAVWWGWLELRRRLEPDEPAALAAARERLAQRMGLGKV